MTHFQISFYALMHFFSSQPHEIHFIKSCEFLVQLSLRSVRIRLGAYKVTKDFYYFSSAGGRNVRKKSFLFSNATQNLLIVDVMQCKASRKNDSTERKDSFFFSTACHCRSIL